ncbi:hypothetical protein PG994_003481 [Apiospora phragmitis]|uniref:BZIP domain-containing protein n=1 Tax=Apiospora phragmitis TaxID=2905665 RepID=A0ABR1VYB0_9PEZI
MKPDEDWRNLPDASERRKIQNRLAQRAYRRNMRDRTREVEKLKSQLKKLQEEKQEEQEAPSQTQEDEDYSGSDSGSSTSSVKGDSEAHMDDLNASPIATSEWLGRYFQAWPESTEPERAGCMDIAANGESLTHLNDAACYSDYQLSPDYPQQIIPPRPMLSKGQDIIIPGQSTLAHQHHPMQSNRAMGESMFYPKAAYQMPWPHQNQRNMAFEEIGNQMGSEPSRRLTLPSPLTSLGQPDLAASPHHQRKPSQPTVGRLLNTELRLSSDDLQTLLCRVLGVDNTEAPSPEKSPVLEKRQKQKKDEVGNRKSRSGMLITNIHKTASGAADHQAPAPAAATNAGSSAATQPTSLLHLAVAGGHVDTLRLLLQRLDAAALNARDDRGYTALECAVMEGRTDLVALLLERGAGGGASR